MNRAERARLLDRDRAAGARARICIVNYSLALLLRPNVLRLLPARLRTLE